MIGQNFGQEVYWLLREKYKGKRSAATQKDIARLEKGEHIDYVIGWSEFLGCRIDLSERPFIPRPETEYWIQRVIEELRRPSLRVLDIFAGSGCIGVAILKHVPWARVDFAEKERKFLKQIRINARLNGIEAKRYRIVQSDVFSEVQGKYDYILANPPYVAEARKGKIQKSVLENETKSAVFGGRDGLFFIRRFLKEAKDFLLPGGVLYMEFDSPQRKKIAELLLQSGYSRLEFSKDQYNKWRYARIVF